MRSERLPILTGVVPFTLLVYAREPSQIVTLGLIGDGASVTVVVVTAG